MGRMDQKVAVIAGLFDETAQGIARRYRQEGSRVAIIAYPDQNLDMTASAADLAFHADIGDRDTALQAVQRVASELGAPDVLVNNVIRHYALAPLERKRAQDMDAALGDVRTALWMKQAVFPSMKERKWGRIVNIGSRHGELMNLCIGDYNAATWGLRGLTRTAAAEWAEHGVIVNMLEATTQTAEFDAYRAGSPDIVDALLDQVALGRRGDPVEDIGAAAVFLSCDESNIIIGQVVYADGGQHIAAPAFNPHLCPDVEMM